MAENKWGTGVLNPLNQFFIIYGKFMKIYLH